MTCLFTVTWHRATRDLGRDVRYRVSSYHHTEILELKDALVTDSGEYVAKATNVHGFVETRCVVKIKRRSPRRDEYVSLYYTFVYISTVNFLKFRTLVAFQK